MVDYGPRRRAMNRLRSQPLWDVYDSTVSIDAPFVKGTLDTPVPDAPVGEIRAHVRAIRINGANRAVLAAKQDDVVSRDASLQRRRP
jgi:hypothetical protein